jgi:hypothetical protein
VSGTIDTTHGEVIVPITPGIYDITAAGASGGAGGVSGGDGAEITVQVTVTADTAFILFAGAEGASGSAGGGGGGASFVVQQLGSPVVTAGGGGGGEVTAGGNASTTIDTSVGDGGLPVALVVVVAAVGSFSTVEMRSQGARAAPVMATCWPVAHQNPGSAPVRAALAAVAVEGWMAAAAVAETTAAPGARPMVEVAAGPM